MKHLRRNLFTGSIHYLLLVWFASANASANERDAFKIGILMFEGVQIIDFAAPYEVFGHAGFEVLTVSSTGAPLVTTMGLNVTPTHSFATMPNVDAVIVPGGNVHNIMHDRKVLAWLQQQAKATEHLLSVCNGAFALAEAGLLDNRAATTFFGALDNFEDSYPSIDVRWDQRFVDNGTIITSAGLSSGIDAALHLVSKVNGLESAKTVAMHLEYDWNPDTGFVRGNMADRHFPDIHYQWPEDARLNRRSHYGSETEFRKTYRVSTKAGASSITAAVLNAMAKHRDWSLVSPHKETADSKATWAQDWRGNNTLTGWHYGVTLLASGKDEYLLTATIQREK